MKYSLRKLAVAETDMVEAGVWYEEQQPGAGLARALVDEATAAGETLRTDALHHRIRFRDVRRAPLRRFASFGMYYVVRGASVIVIAVFHDARDPRLLRGRRRDVAGEL